MCFGVGVCVSACLRACVCVRARVCGGRVRDTNSNLSHKMQANPLLNSTLLMET